ncbi:bifunctional glycosyltransferase/CDP-glycerol:glycerophosphate glycerophosphotransferase [Streptomyces sp. SP18CS02]|uniref:bifunctional glycosyltransferase/CDP-glycerol:glycerophosphate glycerophosphotransferase n=1 Tax=Streptomyces sp. SP18CS02 TaxID=3002531 RepID=UPI002E776E06|nr:CDP-glycerol glycerophosphotransferase family protein [Streptomyces sp. SP18CS02]MEE1752216.1 CDP-glycerol glycerophosphotransferase family protein [Streptomyces sp. SP18CS02]
MPKLSVIVSGRSSQSRLRACLESVTAQTHPDLDIVVTAGDDGTRALARVHEALDPRVTVVSVPADAPDAVARAAGARAARGTYLQFLRGCDRLPDGAVAALADRLDGLRDRAREPDVLLCDHQQATWWAEDVPGGDGPVLGRAPDTTTLAAHPALLDVAPLLGNRLISARLLTAHPELIGTEGHDELYVSCAVLLLARSVACCDTVALTRRTERPAQRRAAHPDRHFAVFGQYERLHRLAGDAAVSTALRSRLYDRMVDDYLATLARRDELPPALVTEFFRRAARHAERFRPEGHRRPGGLDGVRHSLLGRNAYLRYRLLRTANDARRAFQAGVAVCADRAVDAHSRGRYRLARCRSVDEDLAVFSAYWGRGVFCNPAAIAAELAELEPDIRQVWIVEESAVPLLPPGTDHVVPGTARYWSTLARAKYLVNNVNFPDALAKRPGTVHLQTHHGTPLKHMGVDQRPYPAAARDLDFDALLARVDRWDYSLSANSHSTETWRRAYPSGHRSLDYGYPRNDILYRATAEDVRAARAKLGVRPGQRALLYAPTHRDYEARPSPRLDAARLVRRLGDDTVLLVRGHYLYADGPTAGRSAGDRVLDVTGYDPVEELALAADALITDYSSIMFDYANLDRPIVILADDWETYTLTRGVYFDLTAEPPGPVARTQDELADILAHGAWCDEASAKQRHDFRLRFCEYDDGRAAERVVRRVFLGEGEESLPPVLPLERRTPAPTPQEATRR